MDIIRAETRLLGIGTMDSLRLDEKKVGYNMNYYRFWSMSSDKANGELFSESILGTSEC